MIDEKTRALFQKWGAEGQKVRASKYTKKQISILTKRGLKKRTLRALKKGNGK